MTTSDVKYNPVVKGELDIITDEIEKFHQSNLAVSYFLNCIKPHLFSIEQKVGKSSIEHIFISTKIVEISVTRTLALTSTNDIIDQLSPSDTVKYYYNQRDNLTKALSIMRILENMNMDYAYRINEFNRINLEIMHKCHEIGIDTRTTAQKSIDTIKTVGETTGFIATATAGCAFGIAIKMAIVIVIFLILMAIIGA